MKRCKKITCWTDYQILQLGDKVGAPAPVRHVHVLSYDGDKYATIEVNGAVVLVKSGYLYRHKGRFGQVKQINKRKLERMY